MLFLITIYHEHNLQLDKMDTEQMKGEIRFANADKDSNYTKGSNQTKSDLETAKLGPAVQLDDPNMAKGGEKELQVGKVKHRSDPIFNLRKDNFS